MGPKESDMARTKKTPAPTYDKTAVEAVLAKHRDRRHFMEGGSGVSCFVWINGSIFSSENSLNLANGVEAELAKVPGVRYTKINID